jgi:hypothetical protein
MEKLFAVSIQLRSGIILTLLSSHAFCHREDLHPNIPPLSPFCYPAPHGPVLAHVLPCLCTDRIGAQLWIDRTMR